jgi:hypothetical protein
MSHLRNFESLTPDSQKPGKSSKFLSVTKGKDSKSPTLPLTCFRFGSYHPIAIPHTLRRIGEGRVINGVGQHLLFWPIDWMQFHSHLDIEPLAVFHSFLR